MNGSVFDPQAPPDAGSGQPYPGFFDMRSYDRFSYVWNNPLHGNRPEWGTRIRNGWLGHSNEHPSRALALPFSSSCTPLGRCFLVGGQLPPPEVFPMPHRLIQNSLTEIAG